MGGGVGGLYIEGLFCKIHLGNGSLVCLVIVLFITFGLPPLHRLIHGPFPSFSLSLWCCVVPSMPRLEGMIKSVEMLKRSHLLMGAAAVRSAKMCSHLIIGELKSTTGLITYSLFSQPDKEINSYKTLHNKKRSTKLALNALSTPCPCQRTCFNSSA